MGAPPTEDKMAQLSYKNQTITEPNEIAILMAQHGLLYERWALHPTEEQSDSEVLGIYKKEIETLSKSRGYVSADLVSLHRATPNLLTIIDKFKKEHHHAEDEVRFTVEGEGVFQIQASLPDSQGLFLDFTAEPGDLIVIPAKRRHLFYLTEKTKIRCIRLFKNQLGWEAIY